MTIVFTLMNYTITMRMYYIDHKQKECVEITNFYLHSDSM